MTSGMKSVLNGRLWEMGTASDINSLLHSNYVYACINTLTHKPLYLDRHLHYAAATYNKLYGTDPALDRDEVRGAITELLEANHMPQLGNLVNLYLIPPAAGASPQAPDVLIAWERSTIYRGYELISIRPKAVLTNYEIPFSGHRTAVSLTASDYMRSFAIRSGSHIALRANRAEKVVSCGEYPVFFVKDNVICSPPAPDESPLCVEGELMRRLCRLAGMEIAERSVAAAEMAAADEIMVFNHTGLQTVLSWGSHYYYNLTAQRLEKHLRQLTEEGMEI